MAGDMLQNAPVRGMKKKRFPRPFGRYILEKSLSRGGMGEVYLAVVKKLNKHCVIKTIRGDLTGEQEFVGRFADEAKIMVRISHDNIIRVFDAGKVGGDYYIAMEYIHGRDLGDVLDRAYERGEPMPQQMGVYVTQALLAGLEHTHSLTDEHGRHMGLVHRDISPQNILIGFDGSVKLIDFGLARTDVLPARTQGALAVGKYGYMSPEQARHQDIDGRADIYSAGVMLFEVFTGDRLVDEQDQATLWSRVLNPKHRSPRTVLPNLPSWVDDLVMRAVAVRPEDRFPSAGEMERFVQRYQTADCSTDNFIKYLRRLYPRVDFTPPAVPQLERQNMEAGVEKSIIFATSREGARSVFGRGELPIEGTQQINAFELRAELDRRFGIGDTNNHEVMVVEQHTTGETRANTPEPVISATPIIPQTIDPAEAKRPVEQATQVARYPSEPDSGTEETRFMRPPSPAQSFTEDLDSSNDEIEGTLADAGPRHLGISSVTTGEYRDDEATVMMSAPPRSLVAELEEEESDEVTRLSERKSDFEMPSIVPQPGSVPSPTVLPAQRRRAIKERVRTQARDQQGGRDRDHRELGRDTVRDRQAPRQVVAHQATVPTNATPIKTPFGDEEATRAVAGGLPPQHQQAVNNNVENTVRDGDLEKPVNLFVPGIVLFGLALFVLGIVVFMLD